MPSSNIARIQDGVHGLLEFQGMETVVIEVLRTPELQRLRRIRQLGLAHLVFPCSEHSRLVHSLGAAYLAIKFGKQIRESCRDYLVEALRPKTPEIRDLAVAALCHDLGHGPLSHVWEREVVDYDHNKWAQKLGLENEKDELKSLKWHELITQALLAWENGELHQLLERHDAGFSKRLRYMLRGEYYIPYLPRLLRGDIDLDRADYLRRDTHQSGVAYGRYDLGWLISTCTVGKNDNNQLVVGFDKRKSLRVVEQFLIARRALYETVYYHKTVRSAEGMVTLFLRRLRKVFQENPHLRVPDFVEPIVKIISGEAIELREILSVDDYSLWVLIHNISKMEDFDLTAKDLAQRITSRDLFKIIPCPSDSVSNFLLQDDGYSLIYNAINTFCPGRPEYYLVVDNIEFSMFSNKESEKAYFIDQERNATQIENDDTLRQYWPKIKTVRLFTIREAVEAVQKLIVS